MQEKLRVIKKIGNTFQVVNLIDGRIFASSHTKFYGVLSITALEYFYLILQNSIRDTNESVPIDKPLILEYESYLGYLDSIEKECNSNFDSITIDSSRKEFLKLPTLDLFFRIMHNSIKTEMAKPSPNNILISELSSFIDYLQSIKKQLHSRLELEFAAKNLSTILNKNSLSEDESERVIDILMKQHSISFPSMKTLAMILISSILLLGFIALCNL